MFVVGKSKVWRGKSLLRFQSIFRLKRTIRLTEKVDQFWKRILIALKNMNSLWREIRHCRTAKSLERFLSPKTKLRKLFVTLLTSHHSKGSQTRTQFWTSTSTNWHLCGKLRILLAFLINKIDHLKQMVFSKFTAKIRSDLDGLYWINSRVWSSQNRIYSCKCSIKIWIIKVRMVWSSQLKFAL